LPQRSSKRASVVARDDNDGWEDNHEDIDKWTMTRGQQLRKWGQQNKDNNMRRPTTEGRTMTRGNDDGREDGNSRKMTQGQQRRRNDNSTRTATCGQQKRKGVRRHNDNDHRREDDYTRRKKDDDGEEDDNGREDRNTRTTTAEERTMTKGHQQWRWKGRSVGWLSGRVCGKFNMVWCLPCEERGGRRVGSFALEKVGREGVIVLYAQQPTIATADAGRGGEPNVVVEEGELNVVWWLSGRGELPMMHMERRGWRWCTGERREAWQHVMIWFELYQLNF